MAARLEQLDGGSAWDDEVYNAFRSHVQEEDRILASYEALAGEQSSPDVAFLVRMIAEDEKRHHELFAQLADTVRTVVELEPSAHAVPDIPLRRDDAQFLRRAASELLRFERDDARRLRKLRRELRPVHETTIWPLLVETMELDTKKHILILKHILKIAGGVFGD